MIPLFNLNNKYFCQYLRLIKRVFWKEIWFWQDRDGSSAKIGSCSGLLGNISKLTAKLKSSNQFIPSNRVKIHDRNVQRTISDLLPRNLKFKCLQKFKPYCLELVEDFWRHLVKCWIKVAFIDRSLLLIHPLFSEHEPDLDIWIRQPIDIFGLEISRLSKEKSLFNGFFGGYFHFFNNDLIVL